MSDLVNASKNGDLERVRDLIKNGADVDKDGTVDDLYGPCYDNCVDSSNKDEDELPAITKAIAE